MDLSYYRLHSTKVPSMFVSTLCGFMLATPLMRSAHALRACQPRSCLTQVRGAISDERWYTWAAAHGIAAPKLAVYALAPVDRGKGGVFATETIAPLEVVARIPRALAVTASKDDCNLASTARDTGWHIELTAAVLRILHSKDDRVAPVRSWLKAWEHGGWATDNADLGAEGVRWGASDVTGNLMATGSDNDRNIYAKFRFPCHPVVHRAGLGLAILTGADKNAALDALTCRGTTFRAMRDALIPLVVEPSPRSKGSLRDRRSWDVSDALSRVLSRATYLQWASDAETPTCALVPLHDRLAHCDARGENVKVVGCDPHDVLLVATREIAVGEAITRDYNEAPRLRECRSDGALRLLLQFGLPPAAWPKGIIDERR